MSNPQRKQSIQEYGGLRRLSLSAFRSYESTRLDFDVRPVVLTGPNGAGKTNLLEAISFLSPGRGFRQASSCEGACQHSPNKAWAVSAVLDSSKGTTQLGVGLDPDSLAKGRERKVVRIDQDPVRSQATLNEYIHVTWLTPAMDRLFMGAPSDRRRFLDRIVFGHDPLHSDRIKRYEHATRERLKLLKSGNETSSWLDGLERQMATEGLAMAKARRDAVAKLTQALGHHTTSFPRAKLALSGWVEEAFQEGLNLSDIEVKIRGKLQASRAADALIGMTRSGPHRTDLLCWLSEKNRQADQCSTGEQKALLLSIVLAAARIQQAQNLAAPIVLLDEVVAHLDVDRRKDLFDEIEALGLQTWMTGTDFELFEEFKDRAQFFSVEKGIVSAKNVL